MLLMFLIVVFLLTLSGHVDNLFPYFVQHARTMFPHLDCIDDLQKISDLRHPANWFVFLMFSCCCHCCCSV